MPQLPGLTSLAVIGHGGHGVVYRAWRPELHRTVAVKVLGGRPDSRAAQRFTQECRTLGAISGHPNIVPVYTAGVTGNGEPYLVMGLCPGGSLAARLRRQTVGWKEMLSIGVALAGALHSAHEAGVLHGDLRPANILLDAHGNPQLADFGQARLAGPPPGCPAWTAPEVLGGAAGDRAADVYSLAASLLTLVAGRGPFSRDDTDTPAAVTYRVLHERPRNLRELRVPEQVCRVLEWGLSRDPRQRPPDALAFGQALAAEQRESGMAITGLAVISKGSTYPPEAPPMDATTIADAGADYGITQPRTPPRWLPAAAAGAALLTVLVLLVVALLAGR